MRHRSPLDAKTPQRVLIPVFDAFVPRAAARPRLPAGHSLTAPFAALHARAAAAPELVPPGNDLVPRVDASCARRTRLAVRYGL